MNKLIYFFSIISVAAGGFLNSSEANAGSVDNEGYPLFYIRGDFDGCSWTTNNFPFTRTGDSYTIHLSNLDGRFKITNDDWTINYGAPDEEQCDISASIITRGVQNGPNYRGHNLKDIDIFFVYNPDHNFAEITIKVEGKDPVENHPWSDTLPVLYINVYDEYGNIDNEINSKDLDHKNYFNGEYWLDLNGCEWMAAEGAQSIGDKDNPLPLQIKARGNWTRRGFSKKPFKLKLEKKQSLLGLSKSKHFAILAHADDSWGYLKNFTGFNLGRRMELPWTPSQQPVEVVINGNYRGLYFLTESIRVEKDRVNITELEDNASDPNLVSGGYLVELDNYDEENQIVMEEKTLVGGYTDRLRITFDTPEEYSDIQRHFIEDQFSAMNNAVGSGSDDLWSYMDLDDAARYYIVEEIISHVESYHGSTYLFRDRGADQKWHFSPLWDCGNAFVGPTNNYFTTQSPFGNTWIASMRENHKFMNKVKETWKWFMSQKFDGLYEDIDLISQRLTAAAQADYDRWNNQPVPFGGMPVCDNRNMPEKANNAKNHLQEKISWLKGKWGIYSNDLYPEPERDNTPAAPLPIYISTDIDEVSENVVAPETSEYFNLQGIKVTSPRPGEIYIVRSGEKTRKVIY